MVSAATILPRTMSPLLLLLFSFPVLLFFAWKFQRKRAQARRIRHLQAALNPLWIGILERNVSLYRKLPQEVRLTLHGCINLFLDEKEFVGCEDVEITDEIRLTVAGNACLLVMNNRKLRGERDLFPGFSTILVYPDTYVAKQVRYDGMVEIHEHDTRAGESWHGGPLVLSWADVLRGSRRDDDGFNVVLHEFAHKIDEENGASVGLPVLSDRSHYADWARVLSEEYEEFLNRVERDTNHIIDEYGAVSSTEFFAVTTESFFEKPRPMQRHLPELYKQFERLYCLSPHIWSH